MVLECGGNGRSFFEPQAAGNPWTNGGAGCAEWTGVSLSDVLREAGLKETALFTGHFGADPDKHGSHEHQAMSRGVPIAKALEEHTLLVWAMNGEPLAVLHGGPLRLIVPGWPGSLSQKWLTRIWIRDREHDGPGMTGLSYRMPVRPLPPGRMRRAWNCASWNRCPCAASSPLPLTAPDFLRARVTSRCAARPGRATTQWRVWIDHRRRRDLASRHDDATAQPL